MTSSRPISTPERGHPGRAYFVVPQGLLESSEGRAMLHDLLEGGFASAGRTPSQPLTLGNAVAPRPRVAESPGN